jgi:hypothetical protein
MDLIVPEETKALASGQGPIYLNLAFDVQAVRESLISDLKTVTDAEPLFTDVHRADSVYDRLSLDIGPYIVLDQRPGVHVNDGMGRNAVQMEPDRWAAENTSTGFSSLWEVPMLCFRHSSAQ